MYLCFYTTDLYNTKTKSKLTKNKTEPYLIFGDQMGNGKIKKTEKKYINTSINLYTIHIAYNLF